MAKIRIERLCAGNHKEDGAKRVETDNPVMDEKASSEPRIECEQDGHIMSDMPNAGSCDGCKPQKHYRAKEGCDTRRTARLNGKQRDQNEHGQRHHVRIKRWCNNLQSLDRREDRQCRG